MKFHQSILEFSNRRIIVLGVSLFLGVDVVNTSYYVVIGENCAVSRDVMQSWKMTLGGHGKSWKSNGKFAGKKCGNLCRSFYVK